MRTAFEQTIFRAGEGYGEYRIPGILPVENALLITCEGRTGTSGDWGDIDVLVFRAEMPAFPTQPLAFRQVFRAGESHLPFAGRMRTYNNPVLIPDGRKVHLIFHKNYEQAFLVTSEDGGRSWGEIREITAAYREADYAWNVCATGPGHGIRTRSGRLVAPIWLASGEVLPPYGERRHYPSVSGCVYSDDGGANWHCGFTMDFMKDPSETTVCELADGRLLFNFRNCDEDKHRKLGLSRDGGQTLLTHFTPEALICPTNFGSSVAVGKHVFYCGCASTERRVNTTVWEAESDLREWKEVWHVDDAGGYPDIACAFGRIFVLFERTDYENDRKIAEIVLKISDPVNEE